MKKECKYFKCPNCGYSQLDNSVKSGKRVNKSKIKKLQIKNN